VDATMLLCDHAEAINGKLYIMGGGWSVCPPGPRNMTLAVKILVPWDEANEEHRFRVSLMDDAGNIVELGEPPKAVVHEGQLVVGRPPHIKKGTPLDVVLAFGFIGLPLASKASYRWQLEINNEPVCDASFQTTEGN